MDTTPFEDGKQHINIYSRGQTNLGRALSNFAKIGFIHPKHGEFESVEGYWYWLSTGKKHQFLRHLSGFKAKEEGKKLERVPVENFKDEIERVIRFKITQNPDLLQEFKMSVLPFKHYYMYGTLPDVKTVYPRDHLWLVGVLESLRERLNRRNLRVIVAGSRSIKDISLVRKAIKETPFDIGCIVSGMAPGVDNLAEQVAIELELNLVCFPADWDNQPRAAGMIRNGEMEEYSDALISIWDGRSRGTQDMMARMKGAGKPVDLHHITL